MYESLTLHSNQGELPILEQILQSRKKYERIILSPQQKKREKGDASLYEGDFLR